MNEERELLIRPVVPETLAHNAKWNPYVRVVSDIRNLTASIFGIAAGTLGLESYLGFLFYLVGTLFVSFLMATFLAKGKSQSYFQGGAWELWTMEAFNGLSSFVLTWTLFFGLVRV